MSLIDKILLIILLTSILLWLYVALSVLSVVGLGAFAEAASSGEFFSALALSLETAGAATLLATPAALAISYMLSRNGGLVGACLESILTLPFTMTPVALGSLVLLFIAATHVGRALDSSLSLLYTLRGAVLVQTILAFSAMLTPMVSAFEGVSVEYEELSRTLGHGPVSTFFYVVLPLAKRGILSSVLLGFMKAFSDFGATVMVAGMLIGRTATIPATIFVEMSSGNVGVALALIMLSAAASLAIGVAARALRGGRGWLP